MELKEKMRQVKNNRKKMKHCMRKLKKNVMKPKRRGSMTSAEMFIITTKVLCKQCAEI